MIATIYTVVGIMTMVGSPITHFLWIAISLFLAFYLIHTMPDYFTAVGFGFLLAGAIPLWDETYLTVNQRTENTLWLGASVVLGSAVTVAVEYVFRRVHPITELTQALESRLQAVEGVLRQTAADLPLGDELEKEISQYSALGTSRHAKTVAALRLSAAAYRADEHRRGLAGAFDRSCGQHADCSFHPVHRYWDGRSRAMPAAGEPDLRTSRRFAAAQVATRRSSSPARRSRQTCRFSRKWSERWH